MRLKTNKFPVTAIGCDSGGYAPEEIAPIFLDAAHLDNVYLPESFWNAISS